MSPIHLVSENGKLEPSTEGGTMQRPEFYSEEMERLFDAVMTQMGYEEEPGEFYDALQEIAGHGADSGWAGFSFYADTVQFYDSHRRDIITLARGMMEELGIKSLAEFVAGFNCLDMQPYEVENFFMGEPVEDTEELIKNALAWFALEEVARFVSDWIEENPKEDGEE